MADYNAVYLSEPSVSATVTERQSYDFTAELEGQMPPVPDPIIPPPEYIGNAAAWRECDGGTSRQQRTPV